jgi:hypothetical protein
MWRVTEMPVVPHYPTDEPEPEEAPRIGDIVDRIIRGGDDAGRRRPVPQ